MKILFVHEVSYTKKVIFEMHEFPELLAEKGHQITFLHFNEGYKFWRNSRLHGSSEIDGRVTQGIKIRLVTPFQLGIPGLDRVIVILSSIPRLWKLLRDGAFDVVVLYAVPTYGYQVLKIAKRFGVPVVFRALDVSHLIRNSLLAPLIQEAEKYVYRKATLVSANNPAMARYCLELAGRIGGSRVNLPPLDFSHFAKRPPDSISRKSFGWDSSHKVVAYMGTFFRFSGLPEVIQALPMELEKNPNLRLLLIGGGEQQEELSRLVAELDLENFVTFTGFVTYAELPAYLRVADVAINPMIPQTVSNKAFPHKVLQYMASSLPVVSTKLEGLYETFGEASGILWVGSPDEILCNALSLAENSDELVTRASKQSVTVSNILGSDKAITNFESVLSESVGLGK
jgi:glycosyltransferase involved in cell wall biosynthesis